MSSRPWSDVELPADVLAVPTMLSNRERQLLYWLARYHVQGVGRIIDGGSFLGGSTAALASGLASRTDGSWDKMIAAFERFKVEAYTLEVFGDYLTDHTVGASFREAFDKLMSPWSRYIEVKAGNILESVWDGAPIEVLFLDVVKNWCVNDFVLEKFLPCLIPGHSIILQQDYLWGFGPWLHITMELMESSVRILDSMPNGTVAYLLTAPVPKELIGVKLRNVLSNDRKRFLMDRAVERWQGEEQGLVELARVMLIAETNDVTVSQAELDAVLARHPNEPRVRQCAAYVAQFVADASRKMVEILGCVFCSAIRPIPHQLGRQRNK